MYMVQSYTGTDFCQQAFFCPMFGQMMICRHFVSLFIYLYKAVLRCSFSLRTEKSNAWVSSEMRIFQRSLRS
jgi:hypothetical protein